MNMKKIVAAKGTGRKILFEFDTLLPLVFMFIVLTYAFTQGFRLFSMFAMGLIIARIGEIIFEVKDNFFEKPFFHCLLLIGIPLQCGWNVISG